MPPKTTKRGAAASGAKRGGRAPRGTSKAAQNQQQQPEPVEEKAVIEEEPKVEENPVVEEKPVVEENPVEDKAIDMNEIAPEAAAEEAKTVKSMFFFLIKKFWFEFCLNQ
jgi:hypothetical protein